MDANKWISMEDRLPEENGRYLCYVKEQNDLGISYYQWNCAYTEGVGFIKPNHNTIEITHWQPLPTPPKQ
jgi:hypothetical protein